MIKLTTIILLIFDRLNESSCFPNPLLMDVDERPGKFTTKFDRKESQTGLD